MVCGVTAPQDQRVLFTPDIAVEPMRRPVDVPLRRPVALSDADLRLLRDGLGRVEMELTWMVHLGPMHRGDRRVAGDDRPVDLEAGPRADQPQDAVRRAAPCGGTGSRRPFPDAGSLPQLPLTFTTWCSVCRTSTRSAASAMTWSIGL